MMASLKQYWSGLSQRDQRIFLFGVPIVALILFWGLIYQPMKHQIDEYQKVLPQKRADLAWIRQQRDLYIKGGAPKTGQQNSNQGSLIAILEQTAQSGGVKSFIQSLSPGTQKNEARVLLVDADFNRWLQWSESLYKKHQVSVKRLTVQKEDSPNIAEIRVTFER